MRFDCRGAARHAVYAAKYGVLAALLRLGRDVTFGEMDIWLLRDPLVGAARADIVSGVHQDNPYNANAGWLHARADNGDVAALFEDLLRYCMTHPDAFDQQVLNCLLKAAARPQSSRDDCTLAQGASRDLGATADSILAPWTVPPSRVSYAFLGPDVLVAHARPYVLPTTVGIHVLTTIPLTDARAKTDVARELMFWPGAHGYYRIGDGARYLAVDGGILSTSRPSRFHAWRWVTAALAELVWLARLTGRTLIWPRIFDFQQFHHAADHLDLRSVEALLGGWRAWRESTFLANPRLDVVVGATYATVSLRTNASVAVVARKAFDDSRLPTGRPGQGPSVARTYTLPDLPRRRRAWGAWAVALADEDAAAADVLLIDFEAVGEDDLRLAQCFHGQPAWTCRRAVEAGDVPRELVLIQARLGWCRQKLGHEHAKAPNGEATPVGYQPSKTCAVRLATGLLQRARVVDPPGRDSLVDKRW